MFTFGVPLAFEDDEGVASMRLLQLTRLLIGMGISNNANLGSQVLASNEPTVVGWSAAWISYPFNGTEATEFSLQILFCGTVVESRDNESLESIATNVRVFVRLVCKMTVST